MITLLAAASFAQEPVADVPVDLPLTLGAGTVWMGLYLGPQRGPALPAEPWEEPGGLDVFSVDHTVEPIALASDMVLNGSMLTGLVLSYADGSPGHRDDRVLLYMEALTITGLVTESLKAAVDRPRPYTQTEGVDESFDMQSFPSGHTSMSTAAAMTTVRMMDLRHGFGPGERVIAYGSVVLVGGTAAALRITGGAHFPSDVIAGAAIGGAVGWLVPELHKPGRIASVDAAGNGRVVFRVTFAI